jgi:hypothetical protein
MEVKVQSLMEKDRYERCGDILVIYINDKRVFYAMDGEPEDSNLSRDFNDCWSIPDLMKTAYEAGKNGEPFTVIREEVLLDEI